MEALLVTMHRRNCEYYELAAAGPGEVVRSFEDTSTTLLSPELYRRYCLRQLQDYRDICHAHGKLLRPPHVRPAQGRAAGTRRDRGGWHRSRHPAASRRLPHRSCARDASVPNVTLIGGLDPTQFVGATPDRTRALLRDYLSQIGDGRRMVLGHEEIHITADFESVRVIPDLLEESRAIPGQGHGTTRPLTSYIKPAIIPKIPSPVP